MKKFNPNFNPIGAITLNNSVGGIKSTAVESTVKDGAKIVWMPTFDAEKLEIQYMFSQTGYEELPPWAQVQFDRQKKGNRKLELQCLRREA